MHLLYWLSCIEVPPAQAGLHNRRGAEHTRFGLHYGWLQRVCQGLAPSEELPKKEERRPVEGCREGFRADFMMREETERFHQEGDAAEKRCGVLKRQTDQMDKALD